MKLSGKHRNNKGFTLVELIVTLAVLGIFLAGITTFMLSTNKIFLYADDQWNVQSDSRTVLNQIKADIKYSEEIELLSPAAVEEEISSGSTKSFIYYEGDKIIRSLFSPSGRSEQILSGSYSASLPLFTKAGDYQLTIQLNGINKDQEYAVDSTFVLPNLSVAKNPIKGDVSAQAIMYQFTGTYAIDVAPSASNVKISGSPTVGRTLTGSYVYNDVNGDPEGISTFKWYADDVVIPGVTGLSYTLGVEDLGKRIRFEVTPKAAVGEPLVGLSVKSSSTTPVTLEVPPVATDVKIEGFAQVGATLTGLYVYEDINGDAEGLSLFKWYADGGVIAGATSLSYTLTGDDVDKAIAFEVTPISETGAPTQGDPVSSDPSAFVVAGGAQIPPVASDVYISGTAQVGETLTASYTYSDANGDAEGESDYRWYADGIAIIGARELTYVLEASAVNKRMTFQVTPVDQEGLSGTPVESSGEGLLVAAKPIDTIAISGIKPIKNGTPKVSFDAVYYSATITWSPNTDKSFKNKTVYTATITLTTKTGYIFMGTPAISVSVADATSISHTTNASDQVIITATFPQAT